MSLMEDSFGGLYEPHEGFIWRFVCASQRIQLDIFLNLMEDSVGGFCGHSLICFEPQTTVSLTHQTVSMSVDS